MRIANKVQSDFLHDFYGIMEKQMEAEGFFKNVFHRLRKDALPGGCYYYNFCLMPENLKEENHQKKTLYVNIENSDLRYSVVSPFKGIITDKIEIKELPGCQLTALENLGELEPFFCAILDECSRRGHILPSIHDAIRYYFSFKDKFIFPRRYTIKYSHKLTHPHLLVTPERMGVLKEIEDKLRNGEDVTPYLSKTVREFDKKDFLLNSWNIRHLHLNSIATRGKGFVKRSKVILLLIVERETVYFLDVVKHRNVNEFSDPEYVRLIAEEFPELCAVLPLPIGSDTDYFDAQQIKGLMAAGGNTFVLTKQGPCFIANGGITTAGTAIRHNRVLGDYLHAIYIIQEQAIQLFSCEKELKMIGFDTKDYIITVFIAIISEDYKKRCVSIRYDRISGKIDMADGIKKLS